MLSSLKLWLIGCFRETDEKDVRQTHREVLAIPLPVRRRTTFIDLLIIVRRFIVR